MKLQKNDGGGTSVILGEGDLLSTVPESHADILTPEIQAVFENPAHFFKEIARRTPIANLCRYLDEMTSGGEWHLVLADTYMPVRQTI
ncbi:hypothetical protein, partial [Schlesneria sp.]|uniref:hypothetical protein n=1 Tax=Schlesneria sp. TaxID=2762018 RepID=UPI002EF5F6AE